MAVAFDAASAKQSFGSTSPSTWTHTATGSNPYVRLYCSWVTVTGTATISATYGGVSMTLVGSVFSRDPGTGQSNVAILELINPPTGSQTVALTLNLSGIAGDCATVSYTGVHQTTASGSLVTDGATTGRTTSSCSVSSNTGDMVGSVIQCGTGVAAPTGTQTSRYSGTANGAGYGNGAQDATGAATVSMDYSWSGGAAVAACAANILQAAPVVPIQPFFPIMQLGPLLAQ